MILRYVRDGRDVFGLEANDGAYLIVVNRADTALPYFADLSRDGFGQHDGIVAAKSAAYIRIN